MSKCSKCGNKNISFDICAIPRKDGGAYSEDAKRCYWCNRCNYFWTEEIE